MLTELTSHPKVVGVKQTRRAIEGGTARKVFLATDADPRITEPVAALCAGKGLPVERESTMEELGRVCGIAVGCAVAALVG